MLARSTSEHPPASEAPMAAVEVPCPLCRRSGGRLFHTESTWRLLRCPGCSFLYVSPRPDGAALRGHYRGYLPTTDGEIGAWDRMMAGIHRRVLRELRSVRAGGRILDVGCGFGFLVRDLRRAGFEAEGIDISPTAVAHSRETLGVPVREGTIEEAGFEVGSFDAITALYVIEHLPDPIAFLGEAHRVLRPGGRIVLRWPHTAPITRLLRAVGIDLRLHDLPSHLSDFSPATMAAALERAGFEGVRTRTGGWTRPPEWWRRWAARIGGAAGSGIAALTFGRLLLPGLSKTTTAQKWGQSLFHKSNEIGGRTDAKGLTKK